MLDISTPDATDPRAVRSRASLVGAMTGLLDRSEARASITDVVSAAGVSRPTFYQHFADLPALQRASARARLEAAFAQISPPNTADSHWASQMHAAIQGLLEQLDAHSEFYVTVLDGPAGADVLDDAIEFLTERIVKASPLSSAGPRPLGVAAGRFLAAGAVYLCRDWLHAPDPATAPEMAAVITDLLLAGARVPIEEPGASPHASAHQS